MILRFLPIAALLVSLTSVVQLARADRVLLTTFDPFAGRPENRSQAVGKKIQQRLSKEGVEVSICNLPVVYDAAARVAQKCYAAMPQKPDIVLSLGEGSCETRIETRAYNLDDTPKLADNSGQFRKARMILKKGLKFVALNIPAQAMYCALSPEQFDHVRVSNSLGEFVCNNTAYHLAVAFQDVPVQYGFVHVPPSNCGKISDPVLQGAKIAQMLRGILSLNRSQVLASYPFPHSSNHNRLPITDTEFEGSRRVLSSGKPKACELEFLKKLEESYPQSSRPKPVGQ